MTRELRDVKVLSADWKLMDQNETGFLLSMAIPELAFYLDDSVTHPHDRYTWTDDPQVPGIIEDRLKAHDLPYKTIGEFHVFFDKGITPVMKRVAQIAIQHHLILHAHCHAGVVEKWLKMMGPKLKILWAHGGLVCQDNGPCPGNVAWPEVNVTPEKVKEMMDQYPGMHPVNQAVQPQIF